MMFLNEFENEEQKKEEKNNIKAKQILYFLF